MSLALGNVPDGDRSIPPHSSSSNNSPLPSPPLSREAPPHQSDSIDTATPSSFTTSPLWETLVFIKDWFVRHLEAIFSCFCRNPTLENVEELIPNTTLQAEISALPADVQDKINCCLLPYFTHSPIDFRNLNILVPCDWDGQGSEIREAELDPTHPRYPVIHRILSECQQPTYFESKGDLRIDPRYRVDFHVIVLPIERRNYTLRNWEPSYFLFRTQVSSENHYWKIYNSKNKLLAAHGFFSLPFWMQDLIRGCEVTHEGPCYRLRPIPSN